MILIPFFLIALIQLELSEGRRVGAQKWRVDRIRGFFA